MSSTKLILRYARDGVEMTSTGEVLRPPQEGESEHMVPLVLARFAAVPFRKMIYRLSEALRTEGYEDAYVVLERTDHPNITPYRLDDETTALIRTDPIAAAEAFECSASPSTGEKRAQDARVLISPQPLMAGYATLVDAFGENVYFKVREHELECPGCGFWGAFAIPALLKDPDRAGAVFKTAFVCQKRCHQRFVVTCDKEWGWVMVEDLLKTTLERFFLPRAWNTSPPWISRENLTTKYNEYKKEIEHAHWH